MENYKIDVITKDDIDKISDVYNSNRTFLKQHMGVNKLSKEFIIDEIEKMRKIGFRSMAIKSDKGDIVGICDFKIESEAYLSLLMIDEKQKGKGKGRIIYNQLEKIFISEGADRVRIDVVYDYEENAIGFWEKQGFMSCEKIQLEWNGHKLNAVKMLKVI